MFQRAESDELAVEKRRIFEELEQRTPALNRRAFGTWVPAVDVIETDATIVVIVDVAGVTASSLRVLLKGTHLLVAGEKLPVGCSVDQPAAFHLAEREFGRFARTVRVKGAIDARRTTARLDRGELTISLPKIVDRRGEDVYVPIEASDARS